MDERVSRHLFLTNFQTYGVYGRKRAARKKMQHSCCCSQQHAGPWRKKSWSCWSRTVRSSAERPAVAHSCGAGPYYPPRGQMSLKASIPPSDFLRLKYARKTFSDNLSLPNAELSRCLLKRRWFLLRQNPWTPKSHTRNRTRKHEKNPNLKR